MIDLQPYALPDLDLMTGASSLPAALAWIPPIPVIVLGFSGSIEKYLVQETIKEDRIPVMRRMSGGEAVFLSPNMICLSLTFPLFRIGSPYPFFLRINERISAVLLRLGVAGISARGVSDLAIGDRKILGSAIHQDRNRLFYHAVLNVAETPETIARYLGHPGREPKYRGGRTHETFVTSLRRSGFTLSPGDCIPVFQAEIARLLESCSAASPS